MTLVLALALIALLYGKTTEVRLPRAVCAAAAALLALIALPLLLWAAPRALAADQELDEARRAPPNAVELTQAAERHNPFDAEAYELHARALMGVWMRRKSEGSPAEGIVLQSMENAIALRPDSSPLQAKKAHFHREFRKYYLGIGGTSMAQGMAREHLRLEILHQQRAVELYPTYGPTRYALARMLDDDGRPAEALEEYRKALRLSDLAAKERYPLPRMQLGPAARARCLVRLERRQEALDALRSRPLAPGEIEDETDDLMRSVIREAVDAILKPK
jgi:tetratricopeptide (TPR) repeat protein